MLTMQDGCDRWVKWAIDRGMFKTRYLAFRSFIETKTGTTTTIIAEPVPDPVVVVPIP